MPEANEVPIAGVDFLLKTFGLVSVQKENFLAFVLNGTAPVVMVIAVFFGGVMQENIFAVSIAVNEVCFNAAESVDNGDAADVAAVNHCRNALFFEKVNRPLCFG